MAATTMASHTHINNLPTEVLIDIISNVVYHPSTCSDLRDVCPRFRAVVDNYEHSIVRAILDDQYTWARRQYPGLFSSKAYVQPGWRSLETLFSRVAILSNIKSRCIVIRQSRTEVSAWSTGRALTFHHTGMLLLYRISDCETHDQRTTLIANLPQTSLAILTFTLMMSLHILRTAIPDLLLSSNTPSDSTSRSEIELACEELLLSRGPEFLLGLLLHEQDSKSYLSHTAHPTSCQADAFLSALRDEYAAMPARQEPLDDGSPPPTTLIATLRRTFARLCDCGIEFGLVHMWYVLDESCGLLADADEGKVKDSMERIVNGERLEKGKRLLHCV